MLCGEGALAKVVRWSMCATVTGKLVAGAVLMAIWRRGQLQALLHHSDRGSQYTSEPELCGKVGDDGVR